MKKSVGLFWGLSALLLISWVSSYKTIAVPTAEPRDPLAIHAMAVVVDTHTDTLSRVINDNTWMPQFDIGVERGFEVDIPKLRRGGVGVPFFGAWTAPYPPASRDVDYSLTNSRLLALMNALYWTIDQNPNDIGLVKSYQDIDDLKRSGKIAAVLSIEGAYSLNALNALELLRQYNDLGVRAIGLTWNVSNDLGEGVSGKYGDGTRSPAGLTPLGKSVVKEMNRLGIIVDVSHMSEASFWDTIEISDAPVIASHSGASTVRYHWRNLTDDQIRAIAKKKGVVQVPLYGAFLTEGMDRTVSKAVDHIDYIIKLVGVDYVGIGSDFDGAQPLDDLPTCAFMSSITSELVARGYSNSDIHKILGGNSLRVMKATWRKNASPEVGTPRIVPSLKMGEVVATSQPTLTAQVDVVQVSRPDSLRLKVILDGVVHTPEFDAASGIAALTVNAPLTAKYHVVTFVAETSSGQSIRETRIFYVQ